MAKEWYVLRVQAGRENQVKDTLEKRAKTGDMEEKVGRVLVPTERVSEIKGGRKKVRDKKLFPGYIMIEMEFDEELWYLIRETPGIGDFVGPRSRPTPMQEHEVERILSDMQRDEGEKPRVKIEYAKGDNVKIKEGPFENFDGVVEEVVPAKGIVKVIVTIFGRPTPVELEYWQVEAI
jgi:transcriptional antiterminator NusG